MPRQLPAAEEPDFLPFCLGLQGLVSKLGYFHTLPPARS